MKKLILILLSSLIPVLVFASDPAQVLGYADGKIFGEQHCHEAYLPSVKIREVALRAFAKKFAGKEAQNSETRYEYMEAFNDGYYDGTGLSGK